MVLFSEDHIQETKRRGRIEPKIRKQSQWQSQLQ